MGTVIAIRASPVEAVVHAGTERGDRGDVRSNRRSPYHAAKAKGVKLATRDVINTRPLADLRRLLKRCVPESGGAYE